MAKKIVTTDEMIRGTYVNTLTIALEVGILMKRQAEILGKLNGTSTEEEYAKSQAMVHTARQEYLNRQAEKFGLEPPEVEL